ncbi:patatin-like phospholipase family protein [Bradyrhizobium sp. AUGA SZCCT0160]|uniref:patatin-like phospholipase family protein n=1 Tax=Bradyrhizobium sp. AUGA SZCCT0160 TaxID=2807662 RepID=UPI001BA8FF96|nr:patatin-like phospholipase family protein [Bradyrhizobium sp. AUGA SZCCT0160]MBR1191478.1 patatin-like phospholipase family protein [Bradyrhizobium sp. AUGA SZCCT0160]
MQMTEPKIGLALSGGGARAMAFHLGCLRALNDLGILERVQILSTVSGGSVIGALYAANDEPFPAFETRVRAALARGLAGPALRTAFLTEEGLKALLCGMFVGSANLLFIAFTWLLWLGSLLLPAGMRPRWQMETWHLPFRRFASRTTILRKAMDDELFKGKRLRDLQGRRPLLIANAAELRTGSAFYFTPNESGSWRLGRLARPDITLAHAVTASAAYPMFLPALDEELPFDKRDGTRRSERVNLTDGGVYDNLGLAPLWPDRDPSISLNVEPVDTIICCRAGYGLRHDPPSQFMIARLKSAIACIHDRAQNAAMKRLFELRGAGKLRTVILPYLGQDDNRLKHRPPGLVTREEAYAYPTDFSAMSEAWIERLSRRGEQLTKALIAEHAPELAAQPPSGHSTEADEDNEWRRHASIAGSP